MPRLACLALLLVAGVASAKITNPVSMEQLVKEMPIIATAKVSEWLPDKPGLVLTPADKLRGDLPFTRIPVNLAGDKEAKDEGQPAKLIERLEKDSTVVVFATVDDGDVVALLYVNGTWIRCTGVVEKKGTERTTRWRFLHCETYFRKTFKGTTEEMIEAVKSGLKGGKLPAYDEKAEPGYGPPLKKGEAAKNLPFGVIQLPFLGLIAALAALFPAVFGGAAIMMRRWVTALSVASAISILAALVVYAPGWIEWTGLKSLGMAWLIGGGLAAMGALLAAHRYRKAIRDGRMDEYQPRQLDRVGLAFLLAMAVGGLLIARALGEKVLQSPWLEGVLCIPPLAACLWHVLAHWFREGGPIAVSAETVGLWAGSATCIVAGVGLLGGPAGPAVVSTGGSVQLAPAPTWVFEPEKGGEIVSTPCVVGDRVFVTVHHRPLPVNQYGTVYCLKAATGEVVWSFDRYQVGDEDERLKAIFSSPSYSDGKLYFGEGYHTDRNSKLFCLDAADAVDKPEERLLWHYETGSHTESTPAVADGRVIFGAGDDGLVCVDANTGTKLWQYPAGGGLHIDSNPAILDGRVFAGSGTSQRSKENRVFCLDAKTGAEVWAEKVEYSAWGSPLAVGREVYFPTGNGTFSEDRAPVAGLLLARDAATGRPLWERALQNSLVGRPTADRYQVYVGCRDGNCYALDRRTGEMVWNHSLRAPVLASPTLGAHPASGIGDMVYAVGSEGVVEALSAATGRAAWTINLPELVGMPSVRAVSTPVIEKFHGGRRVYIALGFGSSAAATPTARLYCWEELHQ